MWKKAQMPQKYAHCIKKYSVPSTEFHDRSSWQLVANYRVFCYLLDASGSKSGKGPRNLVIVL